jgi:hypothetical protein
MTEQYKRVSNPLTIIAIFAGLAEVAGTVSIKLVSPDLQHIFVWFIMVFPVFLVLLFFFTLNFNSEKLYAPSDFRNDESFLSTLKEKQRVIVDLEAINMRLEEAKRSIVEEAEKIAGAVQENERRSIMKLVTQELKQIQEQVEIAKKSASNIFVEVSSKEEEDEAFAAGAKMVIRTDLLDKKVAETPDGTVSNSKE